MKKFINQKLFILNENVISNSKEMKNPPRSSKIMPRDLGKTIEIHNGKNFMKVLIMKEMVGCKFGEFIRTRKNFKFKKK